MDNHIRDPFAVAYAKMAIDSYQGDTGIGLGSEMSQLLALLALNGMDHFFKEKLHADIYERYMDDGVIAFATKERAQEALKALRREIAARGLELNPKKTRIFHISQPITFLGWRYIIKDNGKIICKPRKGKVKKLKAKARRMARNGIPLETIEESLNSSMASLKWGHAYKEIQDLRHFLKEEIIYEYQTPRPNHGGAPREACR